MDLLAFTAMVLPFPTTTESRMQNTYEFLAVVLGLLLARDCGLRSFSYSLRGDSVSSLTWAAGDRAASSLARRANIVFTLVACDIDALVSDTVHVPGKLNVVYDGLSRGASAEEVALNPARQRYFAQDHQVTRLS